MYINLILGAIAFVILWLYLRKMLVRDDVLKESPADMLERELARRRAVEEEGRQALERLRDAGKERLRPVADAMEELRSALPEKTRDAMSWEYTGDAVTIRMLKKGGNSAADLAVSWDVPGLDEHSAARYGKDPAGGFVVRRSDTGKEERFASLDSCIRAITSFIVDFMG